MGQKSVLEFLLYAEKSVNSNAFSIVHTLLSCWPRNRGALGVWSQRQMLSNVTSFSLLTWFMPTAVRGLSFQLPAPPWSCSSTVRGRGEWVSKESKGNISFFPLSLSQARMPLTKDVLDLPLTFSMFSRCSSTQENQPRGYQHSQESF